MAEPFLGEIRLVAFTFAPAGWAMCDGQMMPKSQNPVLFSLLGYTFGGDEANFALPDLRGQAVMGRGARAGSPFKFAQRGGEPTHTLKLAETPTHTHALMASPSHGDSPEPTDNVLAQTAKNIYTQVGPTSSPTALNSATIESNGGSQPHPNMQPYLCITFMIALDGIFPVRP
jgi:microcystin-dependent protein